MQFVERVEHPGQGSLVSQLALHGCDRGSCLNCGLADHHTSQKIGHSWVNPALHSDLVGGWAIEGDGMFEWQTHHAMMIDDIPA